MKKVISVLLITMMLLLPCSMAASAARNSDSLNTIIKEYKEGDYIFDYFYYSPVKSASDTTKYPIILWLHGQLSGEYKGDQVRQSDVAYFATEENQAKIKGAGGAFVLVPRYPTLNVNLAWVGQNSKIKEFLDKFIADHKNNVDTNRIYVGGYSMGGKAAMSLAAAYPNYIAAIFPASAVYLAASPDPDLRSLINTPTWFFTCKDDNFWGKPIPQQDDWNYFRGISNLRETIRWTQFETPLYNYDGSKILMIGYNEHNVWDAVTHDLIMKNGSFYPSITTFNGSNMKVTLTHNDSFISWLSSQSLNGLIGEEGGGDDGSGDDIGGGSSGGNISGGSGLTFYHIREILEYIMLLFDRLYKALFTYDF